MYDDGRIPFGINKLVLGADFVVELTKKRPSQTGPPVWPPR